MSELARGLAFLELMHDTKPSPVLEEKKMSVRNRVNRITGSQMPVRHKVQLSNTIKTDLAEYILNLKKAAIDGTTES